MVQARGDKTDKYENAKNAGLQRGEASFDIFGPWWGAISRHRKRVGLEDAY